ncbi:MAG: hypothetical protein M1828_003309 [Chrysothrix sp. TS-e1954]|nr:MAG: hypothetical protein M1828_003309 [Chrysothrix sp. TS-e1954]
MNHTSPPSPDHPITLPSSASRLSKHHLPTYTPLFARYLDIQKQRYIEDMDETEVKGRWKRFVEHWNRGQLASGWYDPDTKRRADEEEAAAAAAAEVEAGAEGKMEDAEGEEEEEGTFGPTPAPRPTSGRRGARPPTLNDLALRDEETSASLLKSRKAAHRASAALEKSRLADLLPPSSSEPGSKAHQLEKKRLAASTAATFRASKPQAGELQDVGDAELGFQDEGVGVKGMKMQEERRRSEREIKREEIRLARKAEWEERMAVVREREERSMEGLKRLARERFG